jgi:polysaccharide biosynthesis transport protein
LKRPDCQLDETLFVDCTPNMNVPSEPVIIRTQGQETARAAGVFLPSSQIDVVQLTKMMLGLVVKHWLWILILALVGVGLGIAATLTATPVYRAFGIIQIEPEQERIATVDSVVGDNTRSGGDNQAFARTQHGILRSRSLAARVVARIGPAEILGRPAGELGDPVAAREAATSKLAATVQIRPDVGSRLVTLDYSDPNPDLASKIVNGYIDEYIASNLDRRFEASSYAREFLETRIEEMRQRLERTERELVAYARAQDLVMDDGRLTGGSNASLQTLNDSLGEAIKARVDANQKLAGLRSAGANLQQVRESGTIEALRSEQARLRAQYQQLRQVFGPEYPQARQMSAQIESLDRQIATETAAIQREVIGAVVAEANAAAQAEETIRSEIRVARAAALDTEQRGIEYSILKRELDTNKSLYDGLMQRYREIGLAGGVGVNNVSIVDRALVPTAPFSPRPAANLMTGLLAGLAASALLIFVLETWRQQIRRPEDVQRLLGQQLLGVVPDFESDLTIRELLADNRSLATEAYHSIRAGIQFARHHHEGQFRSIAVTSSRPSEGKTTTAISIATIMARTGLRVLLVDADMRNPSLHKEFQLRSKVGLADLLEGYDRVEDAPIASEELNLSVITAGRLPENAAMLLATPAARQLMAQFEAMYDMVVVDCPPVLGLADAPMIASLVEGVIFVVAANQTNQSVVRRSFERLSGPQVNIIGTILTKFHAGRESYGGYDYNSNYGYGGYQYSSESNSEGAAQSDTGSAASNLKSRSVEKAGGGLAGLIGRKR